jgi:hypothetical protein
MLVQFRVFVYTTIFLTFVSVIYSQETSPLPTAPPVSKTVTLPPNASSGSAAPTPADASKQARKALDAASRVETAVAKAADAIGKTQNYQKAINNISGSTAKSNHSLADDVQDLQSAVEAVQSNNLLGALNIAASDLDSNSTSMTTLTQECDKGKLQQPADTTQQDVTNAQSQCAAAQKDAADNKAAASQAQTGLVKALQSISPYLAARFDDLADKLKPFTDKGLISSTAGASATGKPDPTVILQVLPKGLPALKQVFESMNQYTSAWKSMKPAVQAATKANTDNGAGAAVKDAATNPPPADADTEQQKLQTTTDNIQTGLAGWFDAIKGKVTADAKTLDSKIADVETDPAKNSAEALGETRDKGDTLTGAQAVVDAWPPLVGFLQDGKPSGFNLTTARNSIGDLQKWTNQLRASISRLNDALAGDFEDAEADQVSLYYFTDVPRLMQVLNGDVRTIGGVADAQAKAADQRTALTQVELELADAQATVNRYQKQLLDLQEQQRQAQEKLKALNANVSKMASRLKHAQDAKQAADTDAGDAQTNGSSTGATDPTKVLSADRAKAKQTATATKESQAQSDYDAAKTERDNAQSQLDDTQNQKDSLPAKIEAAQTALSDAQAAVSTERRKMVMAAQAESDAFAFARDNAPFMYAPADASSPDPAKRVVLYAFNDSKTIFMRGHSRDLALVKQIIATFDKPSPQARLTLWTFELNADSNQKTNAKAAENLNKSMEIIDEELSAARALENTTLSLLRDVINQEVRKCFKRAVLAPAERAENKDAKKGYAKQAELDQIVQSTCVPASLDRFRTCQAVATPSEQCLHACEDAADHAQCGDLPVSTDKCLDCTTADREKLRRIYFYDPLVLENLGFSLELDTLDLKKLRELIPDPAGTTTLGEALMILSLAPLETRLSVRNEFEKFIQERLEGLQLSTKVDKSAWCHAKKHKKSKNITKDVQCQQNQGKYLLPLTWHALDIWEQGIKGSGIGLTGSQLEITRALRTAFAEKQVRRIFDEANGRYADLRLAVARPQSSSDSQAVIDRRQQLQQNLIKGLHDDAKKLQSVWGVDTADFTAKINAASSEDDLKGALVDLKIRAYQSTSLSSASPRVAAADQMLKEIIIALEDDLDQVFVQPMIRDLRTRLTTETGVRVGILQRESMLASNRGKARVDPKASAQLAVGQEEDILAGVQQLAQLYATVQSGGALAALGALQQQPREAQPEIFALTTGNKFEVTPIFDPSGQALRFKFDFVSTSNLQEPNGTTNPQMPRIERHTVNTEVQLSNLETREISRFESNARLGLPTTYWGGLPIFKDIPGFRPWVPLIGWFVRKGGSNASAQQSVIFGQTTMYPTIGAIIDLLSGSETSSDRVKKNDGEAVMPAPGTSTQPTPPPVKH